VTDTAPGETITRREPNGNGTGTGPGTVPAVFPWPFPDPPRAFPVRVPARLVGAGPAALFGLHGKGRLELGADADLTLLDPSERRRFSSRDVQALCGWSAYEGWTFTGRFTGTVKADRVAWDFRDGFSRAPESRRLQGSARPLEVAR
jgi:hypothetical protein